MQTYNRIIVENRKKHMGLDDKKWEEEVPISVLLFILFLLITTMVIIIKWVI